MKEIKQKVRDLLLNNLSILGKPLAEKLIRYGYLIKSSYFYGDKSIRTFNQRDVMYRFLADSQGLESVPILYIEFGVYKGESLRWWLKANKDASSHFYGFDTFEGLPEDWGNIKKGTFSIGGNFPKIDDNRVHFVKGLFQDTLDEFLKQTQFSKRVIWNLDADLYSSTHYVLSRILPYLKKSDLIIFDEFFSFAHAATEYKAFLDLQEVSPFAYKPVCRATEQYVVEVL
jgi:O-methyltransferase